MSEVPKIVAERLRDAAAGGLANGAHPDPDVLTAFAEQALPAAEREQVLVHLALCPDCREAVALSLPPSEAAESPKMETAADAAAPVAIGTRRTRDAKREGGWFTWPRLTWAALAAGVVVASVLVLRPGKPHPLFEAKQAPPTAASTPSATAQERPAAATNAESDIASTTPAKDSPLAPELDREKALTTSNAAVAWAAKSRADSLKGDAGRATVAELKREPLADKYGLDGKSKLAAAPLPAPEKGAAVGMFGARDSEAVSALAGGLRGTIVDMSGAVVPGAEVTLRNEGTGASQTTTTDVQGQYQFHSVEAGRSALLVNKPGFKTFEIANLRLGSGQINEIDGKLDVGSASETVEVQTSSAMIGVGGASANGSFNKKETALARNKSSAAAVPAPRTAVRSEVVTETAAMQSPQADSNIRGSNQAAAAKIAGAAPLPQTADAAPVAVVAENRPLMAPAVNKAKPAAQKNEQVEVTGANIEQVEVSANTVEQSTITASAVNQLPLNGRNVTQLNALEATWSVDGGALKRSLDGGGTWQAVLTSRHALICYAARGSEVWAGGRAGTVFHSADMGTKWAAVHPAVDHQKLHDDVAGIEFGASGEVVLTTGKAESWTTADGGKTWVKK